MSVLQQLLHSGVEDCLERSIESIIYYSWMHKSWETKLDKGAPNVISIIIAIFCVQIWLLVHAHWAEITRQGWGLQVTPEFCVMSMELLHVTILAPGIWKWLLDIRNGTWSMNPSYGCGLTAWYPLMCSTNHSRPGSLISVSGRMVSHQILKGAWSGTWVGPRSIKALVLGLKKGACFHLRLSTTQHSRLKHTPLQNM